MRLKVSQIVSSADPDARARSVAQAVLQGKTSDLADSRDYASRLAASLDYEVNLRCELEMLRLHETIDLAVAQRLEHILTILRREFPSGSER